MQRIPIFWLPWRQPNLCPLPALMHTDRRRAARRPLDLPLRLRLGTELVYGHARDLGPGGIGMWFVPQPDTAHVVDHALAGHERGALELLMGDIRLVVRVRIAHIKSPRDGIHIGLAIDDSGEAERLMRRLEAYGVLASGAERPTLVAASVGTAK